MSDPGWTGRRVSDSEQKVPWGRKILLAAAVVSGCLIAYVDSRPTWDDTGVTVAAILLASGLFGACAPKRPWLQALAVGSWLPLLYLLRNHSYGPLFALLPAFVGAYVGGGMRRALSSGRK